MKIITSDAFTGELVIDFDNPWNLTVQGFFLSAINVGHFPHGNYGDAGTVVIDQNQPRGTPWHTLTDSS